MDFSLREEQRDVQNLASQILVDQATPERLRALDESGYRFDETLWRQLAEAGLVAVALEEDVGGSGMGFETLCLLLTEAGRTAAALPLIPVLVGAALPVQAFASEAQRQALLPGVASGEQLVTAALSEPGGDDIVAPVTRAQAQGDDWVLTGRKHRVALADRAARLLVSAQGPAGPVVALVDPRAEGVTLTAQHTTAGEPQFAVALERVAVSADQVIATGERAAELLEWTRQRLLAAGCALTLGLCEKMMNMTASYTSERQQFGRPIATFQAVSHRAADIYIDVSSLRLVTEQAVSLLDQGEDAAEAVTVAKIWAGDVAHRVSQAAQHLHGGIGVDRDYPLFRYCLWAKEQELALGGSSVYLARLGGDIARAAVARVAAGAPTLERAS